MTFVRFKPFSMRVEFLLALLFIAQFSPAQESPHGKIRFECSACHSTDSWKMKKDAAFNHKVTGFPLTGKHEMLQCVSCHAELKFTKQSSDCLSCHTNVHKTELGTNCLRCHTTQSWKISDIVQKHQRTRFPLLGRHASLNCQTCHPHAAQKQYSGTLTECIGCHRNDVAEAKTPNHIAAGFSTDCVQCHLITAFRWGTGFDHGRTAFPLTGAHKTTVCSNCHKNQVFKTTPAQCVACHQTQFSSTTNPNHVAGNFPTQCQTCHSQTAWRPATFSHSNTRFPLLGAHQATVCTQCHVNNQYQGLPTACVGCHLRNFNSTTNPNHVASNYPTQCQSCHTQAAWRPASFNHSSTRFGLTGRHVTTACASCHVNNNYNLSYQDCYQCHATQFAQPTNPNHVTSQFSHDCTPCHTTTAWRPSTFNHDGQYFRIYSGKHNNKWTNCTQCHPTAGQYQVFTCISCHEHNQTSMDQEHRNKPGYNYSSPACYNCHRNV